MNFIRSIAHNRAVNNFLLIQSNGQISPWASAGMYLGGADFLGGGGSFRVVARRLTARGSQNQNQNCQKLQCFYIF